MSDEAQQGQDIGVVKNYNAEKGFGFIEREGQRDLFFHINNFSVDAEPPEDGLEVSFHSEPSKRKPGTLTAIKIQPALQGVKGTKKNAF